MVRKLTLNYSWSVAKHLEFELDVRKMIYTVMILSLKRKETGKAIFPQSQLWKLPKEIIYLLFHFATIEY